MQPIITAAEVLAEGVEPRLVTLTGRALVQPSEPHLVAALRRAEAEAKARGWAPQDLPCIAATRQAYRRLGKDPSRYRPSAEALLRRCLQGKELYLVNNLVDIGNLLSIRTGISVGIYDRSRIEGQVTLRVGAAGETYAGLGKGDLNLEGLPLLCDEAGPFGSPTSDSDRTKVLTGEVDFLMVLYGFAPDGATAEHRALANGLLKGHGISVHQSAGASEDALD